MVLLTYSCNNKSERSIKLFVKEHKLICILQARIDINFKMTISLRSINIIRGHTGCQVDYCLYALNIFKLNLRMLNTNTAQISVY